MGDLVNLHAVVHLPLDKAREAKRLEQELLSLQKEIRDGENARGLLSVLRNRRRLAPAAKIPLIDRMLASILMRVQQEARSLVAATLVRQALYRARRERDELYEKRSWLLAEGELRGDWVQCARSHDCYTEDARKDGWTQEPLLGRLYWLCSAECAKLWRERQSERLDSEASRTVEITWEGGKKSLLHTMGKDRQGIPQTPSTESV